MNNDKNPAEAFVAKHCTGSFLSLWGMANPIGKNSGKELCDYLVVCGPDVLIVSVKDIGLAANPTKEEAERWRRKAIEDSAKQIAGAERLIAQLTAVSDRAGRSISLPPVSERRLHRLCVAFGSGGNAGLMMGDLGKGFVHTFDETSFPIILRELDTIADFTHYLQTKEEFFRSGRSAIFPGEEHFLALYLHNGRAFPDGAETIILDDTIWPGFSGDPKYRTRKDADRTSYAWDNVIEYVSRDLLANDLLFVNPPTEAEKVLRILAQECRFNRRHLGGSLTEVLLGNKVRARMTQSRSGMVYVMLAGDRDHDRKYRIAELAARCTIARARFPEAHTVVGIASERAVAGARGVSFDLFMLDQPELTDDHIKEADKLSKELGLFSSPQVSTRHEIEYPTPKPSPDGR